MRDLILKRIQEEKQLTNSICKKLFIQGKVPDRKPGQTFPYQDSVYMNFNDLTQEENKEAEKCKIGTTLEILQSHDLKRVITKLEIDTGIKFILESFNPGKIKSRYKGKVREIYGDDLQKIKSSYLKRLIRPSIVSNIYYLDGDIVYFLLPMEISLKGKISMEDLGKYIIVSSYDLISETSPHYCTISIPLNLSSCYSKPSLKGKVNKFLYTRNYLVKYFSNPGPLRPLFFTLISLYVLYCMYWGPSNGKFWVIVMPLILLLTVYISLDSRFKSLKSSSEALNPPTRRSRELNSEFIKQINELKDI
jgi:hypothetical protein